MNEQEFSDLVESIKQAGEIKRGQREPGRIFEFTPMDIKGFVRNWINFKANLRS